MPNTALTRPRILLCSFAIAATAAIAAPGAADAAVPAGQSRPALSSSDTSTTAGRAISALIGPDPASAMALVPSDFAQRMGYHPTLINGYPANPDGDCSSPIPMPDRFDPLCKTHDLGYDLLRYSSKVGQPLSASARESLDAHLVSRMRGSCHDMACDQATKLADLGLSFNTWRQSGGVPVSEDFGDMVASIASRTGDALLGWLR